MVSTHWRMHGVTECAADCSVCMCRNFNETGDMFKPTEHFCKVAAINHEVVDEKQRQMIEAAKK